MFNNKLISVNPSCFGETRLDFVGLFRLVHFESYQCGSPLGRN
jgi:hypothetical protein